MNGMNLETHTEEQEDSRIGGFSPAYKPAHSWSEISAIEQGLPKMWEKYHKKLIKAAKIKHPQRYLGIITDKKPGIVEGITPTNDII